MKKAIHFLLVALILISAATQATPVPKLPKKVAPKQTSATKPARPIRKDKIGANSKIEKNANTTGNSRVDSKTNPKGVNLPKTEKLTDVERRAVLKSNAEKAKLENQKLMQKEPAARPAASTSSPRKSDQDIRQQQQANRERSAANDAKKKANADQKKKKEAEVLRTTNQNVKKNLDVKTGKNWHGNSTSGNGVNGASESKANRVMGTSAPQTQSGANPNVAVEKKATIAPSRLKQNDKDAKAAEKAGKAASDKAAKDALKAK
jgi:hypothetical protein